MSTKISLTIALGLGLLILGCTTVDNEPTIVATEVWEFIMDNDSSNHGEATFEKKSDGSITTTAIWIFISDGYPVECPVEEGTLIVNGDSIQVSGQGVATNPNPTIPAGYNTSPFTINVKGTAHDGQAQGEWSIAFTTFGWPPTKQGTFTARRQSGSGITN